MMSLTPNSLLFNSFGHFIKHLQDKGERTGLGKDQREGLEQQWREEKGKSWTCNGSSVVYTIEVH